eukprot:m.30532 g.30532  ORF g.30532 m.30532 type:complete len:326 (+) comp9473_c0_seq1:214-1191(+)
MGASHSQQEYEIDYKLGSGAFGEVYRVINKRTREVRALKKIRVASKEEKHAAQREARMLQALNHPNLLKGFSFYEHSSWLPFKDNVIGIIAEFCDRGSLVEAMDETQLNHFVPLPEPEILAIMLQVVACMEYLHDKSIMHRDIKLENILLKTRARRKDGSTAGAEGGLAAHEIKICDLGLASLTVDQSGERRSTSSFAGTKPYMAPEVKRQQPYGFPADMYSLGVVLAELILSQRSWTVHNLQSSIRKCRRVSCGLRRLCLRLMAAEPRARPSARDTRLALLELQQRARSWQRYLDKVAEGDPMLWAIAATAVVLLAMIILWFVL